MLTSFQLYFQPNPLSRVNPSIDSYLGTFQLLRPSIIISAMGKASIQTSKQDRLFLKKKAASFSHSYGSGQCHLDSLVTLLHFPSSTASTKSTTGFSDLQGTFKITYPSSMEQLKRSRAQTFLAACLSSFDLENEKHSFTKTCLISASKQICFPYGTSRSEFGSLEN